MKFRVFQATAICLAVYPLAAQVVFNEIHFDPDIKTEPVEFIELHNTGTNVLDLSGWYLSDGVKFTFPAGTVLSGKGYLVISENPSALQSKFGVASLGPWQGSLSNDGETIELRNAAGGFEDRVDYQLGFPWPTVGDPPGHSIELVNPAFDNDLGGNWRASFASDSLRQVRTLIPDHASWRYMKGVSEVSTPTTAWRSPAFDDSGWQLGTAPIGYGEDFVATLLDDMLGHYTTVFLRNTFVVDDPQAITDLSLEAQYDDGFKVWINGINVLNVNMATGEVPYDGTAGSAIENHRYVTFNLPAPPDYLVPGTNVIAIQAANASLSNSSDFFFDARLIGTEGGQQGPTPGRRNAAFATNLPPQIRQVDHSPSQPHSGEPVKITAKASDPEGVSEMWLHYQVVEPGNYIELTDAAYTNDWIAIPMNDAGTNGDELAGDLVYTALIPSSVQQHRTLVRYRISATDGTGLSLTVPYADDPQPNFAYFCYDGVPAWRGAVHPGVTPSLNFDTNVMRRLPAVQLLAKRSAVEEATWFSRYGGDLYKWAGTLVYDGKVYDHIHFRARGGVWRYAMVKNMWKFDFNRGHDLQMRDDYGHKYDVRWKKLNLGACIQQGDAGHRGEQGMFESVGFRLFNLVGVAAPRTTFLQFRVVDETAEANPTNQYEGDFWGLYLAVEQEDGRFLDEHDLPDNNFYKMEGDTGELSNLGPTGPIDKSDLNYLLEHYTGATVAWWRTNWDLPDYYSYQTIVQAIHHYDINAGKNYFYYRNSETGLWRVVPWDLDLTWAHNMYLPSWGGLNPLASRILEATAVKGTGLQSGTFNLQLTGARPAFELEFRNRIREIRDLLWNTNQAWQLIEDYADRLRDPTNTLSFLDADRCMWDYNPKMGNSNYSSSLGKAGVGRFYQWPYEPGVSADFNGCVQLMKDYVVIRSEHLDSLAYDPSIPATPSLSYVGATNYPAGELAFQCSAYAGSRVFAALQWRAGEVSDPQAPDFDAEKPPAYEISPVWESGEINRFTNRIKIPPDALKVGHAYRVRVRFQDETGCWSHWSPPHQFVVGEPSHSTALIAHLRVSEVMYDPAGGSDFEFIELHNASEEATLDLSGSAFTDGIDFIFPANTLLPPGRYMLVAGNSDLSAFRAHYGLSPDVLIAGTWSGNLANEGEEMTLKTAPGGREIASFAYGKGRGWPVAANGAGHSLVPLNPEAGGQGTGALDYPGNWRASTYVGGSPGRADPNPPSAAVLINELAAHTDYSDPARPEYDSDDWIELYNPTAADVLLANCYLSDDPDELKKWAIPPVTVPARGWITFSEVNDFHNPITTGFGLDKAGEQVLLSYLPGTVQDRVLDSIAFKGQENGVSLGRYPDGAGLWYALPRTRNTANLAPATGVVITELMYHPPDMNDDDNTRDEFVELLNPTAQTVSLEDTNGTWRLEGGIGYTFPPGTALASGESLLVVNFDPDNRLDLAAFRAAYGITDSTLKIFGPYSGKLSNRSDHVALEKPQYPDLPGDGYSWVIVDEVIYGNQSPWPDAADGDGSSLQRLSLSRSGNDPQNWTAATPTPGNGSLDWDEDGLPNDWEVAHGLNPTDPSDAQIDSDGDHLSNAQEYTAGTDPQDPGSKLEFDTVTAGAAATTLQFTAQAGRSYTVQFRQSLAGGLWQNLTNINAQPAKTSITLADPRVPGEPECFYRLVTPVLP